VDSFGQYLDRSTEIIGDRSPAEMRYDKEVIRWMRKGKTIEKAVAKANRKYPDEALQVTSASISDLEAHYEYLEQHDAIESKMRELRKP
jgi:hypothetical protein